MWMKRWRPLLFLLLLVAAHRMHDMYLGMHDGHESTVVEQIEQDVEPALDHEHDAP